MTAGADTETSARERVSAVMSRIDHVRLPEKLKHCRWGVEDGVIVMRSAITGAVYLVDQPTRTFFRTVHPRSNKLTSCSPREVIREDGWLCPCLADEIPGGRDVLDRYRQLPNSRTTIETKEDPVNNTPPVPTASLGIKVNEQRIVIVETTKTIELAPHQIHALLRNAGHHVPDEARVERTEQGYVRIAWTETSETKEGAIGE